MKTKFLLIVCFTIPLFSNAQDDIPLDEYKNLSVDGWLLLDKNSESDGFNKGIVFGATPSFMHTGERIVSNRGESTYGKGGKNGLNFLTNNHVRIAIANGGQVGIGDSNPKELLTVDGAVMAKELQVSNRKTDWPDYVFKEDYSLRSLENLDAYIKKNKHLPEFPSEKEIKAEEHYNLNETTVKLLKTVEELTLHTISLNERVKTLKMQKKEK